MKTIACEHCATKYRVDPERFSSPNPRIRCKKCGEIFTAKFAEDETPTPVAPPPVVTRPPVPTPAPVVEASAGTGTRVLVAHENVTIANQMKEQLTNVGYAVTATHDGVQALIELESGSYKVAILDVSLPKMFGFEVCEVVRRDRMLDSTRLILIAAIWAA